MDLVAEMGLLISHWLLAAGAVGWPPMATGACWMLAGLYGVLSILFEDETPRGNPGIDWMVERWRSEQTNPGDTGL